MTNSLFKNQLLPLALTVVVFGVLVALLYGEIHLLNIFTAQDISLSIRLVDVIVGLTIYLKTSIDFAIYIGNLMSKNDGWKSRIAIEIGTAFGNALGTMIILVIWAFFKEVKVLLALMIFLAALVLFKLAEESLEHAKGNDNKFPLWFQKMVNHLEHGLSLFNKAVAPILKVMPNTKAKEAAGLAFWPLLAVSFSVPFILGLDDFAGYVSLFNVVNVFGFAIGVFLGHMILNIFLYISPTHTIRAVKNPIISFIGTLAFVGLGIWGLVEVVHVIGF